MINLTWTRLHYNDLLKGKMENVICKMLLPVILFLFLLKGVEVAEASPVSSDVNITSCHYRSNGSCITEVTLTFPSTETEKLSFSIDYQPPNNGAERRAADCGWISGKFKCLTERGYNYTPPVNGTFRLSIDLSIHCVKNVTFSITFNQERQIICNLQQDLNCTSGDGKCKEIVHSSEGLPIGIPIGIVLVIVAFIVAVVACYCRKKLNKYCCKCNKDGTQQVQTEDPSGVPLQENHNQQNDEEPSHA